ncbi:arginase [[Clostridium] sordellii]|nr:arginase [[Clostridium] sordellii] [Paeniclostridium sordellii]CEP86032.1 arginase [[Clostridium] sordellii] [Paeniclostridium sordellii]CEP96284.1 arginase [[Clostridium] sordellii] [Paeniclostridium sordellii]CEQ00249.1 arginase [[Clostridium] sordellii] [Paeniclostridium sordellii]
MPLASLMGYRDETFKNLYYNDIKVNEDNVYHIGGRDIDPGEKNFIEHTNMNMFYPKDLKEKGLDSVIDNILNNLNNKNINAIYIGFDLDFIDSKYVPRTGTRVENGFTVNESKYLLKKLVESGLVKSMDLVELNPILDVDDTTSNIAMDIIDTVL